MERLLWSFTTAHSLSFVVEIMMRTWCSYNSVALLMMVVVCAGASQAFAQIHTQLISEPHSSKTPDIREKIPPHVWTDAPSSSGKRHAAQVGTDTFEIIAEKARDAVVNIEIDLPRNPNYPGLESVGKGSGFFIHPDGYILTNAHVVKIAENIHVTTADRKVYGASIVGIDPETDIAVIRLQVDAEQKPRFPILKLGDASSVKPGQWIVAIGNPYGLNHTVTTGIVSAVGRRALGGQLRLDYTNFIQIDAAINLGNSGGPLLNLNGDVVGMNTALQSGNDIGFAIPSDMIRDVLQQMVGGDMRRAWSGMKLRDITVREAQRLANGRIGAHVAHVERGGPAASAGIQQGDVVIEFNDRLVEDSEQLRWWLAMSGIHTLQKLKVIRGDHTLNLRLQMGEPKAAEPPAVAKQVARPVQPSQPSQPPAGPTALGIVVAAPVDKHTNATQTTGLQVLWVKPGSPVSMSGLQAGDRLTHINEQTIQTVKDFERVGSDAATKPRVSLRAVRGNARLFLFFNQTP